MARGLLGWGWSLLRLGRMNNWLRLALLNGLIMWGGRSYIARIEGCLNGLFLLELGCCLTHKCMLYRLMLLEWLRLKMTVLLRWGRIANLALTLLRSNLWTGRSMLHNLLES